MADPIQIGKKKMKLRGEEMLMSNNLVEVGRQKWHQLNQ